MIRTKPMKHQVLAVNFCQREETKEYAGIFADYGTGKTLIWLILTQLRKFKKVLVVSTQLAIDTTWCDQIREHTDFRFCVLRGTAKKKANLLEYAIGKVDNPGRYNYHNESAKPMLFLINYEGVKSIFHELKRAGMDAIVCDESTKIKTFDAGRTLVAQEVGRYIPFRCIMTGFPVTENLAELYAQIKFLDGGKTFGNSYYAFLNKYFVRSGPKVIVKRKAVKQILDAIKPFCIRITNEMMELPPKRYIEIPLEMTDQQVELLRKLNDTFRLELGKVKIDTKYIFTLIAKSLQICDGFIQHIEYEYKEIDGKKVKTNKILSQSLEIIDTNKDEALIETLEQIDVVKNKVTIWCAFLFSVTKLQRLLTKVYASEGIKVLTLTGESEDTNKIVSAFQNSRDCNILICTQKKAAESVTLTSAKYGMYYSNIWSNDARLNSEARIRRKGSEKHESITYIDLVTKDTKEVKSVERKVYNALRKKKDLIKELKDAFKGMQRG